MAQPNPELRDPQQALADVRGELHECTDERDAAQAPELATAEVLRMINGSGGHVTPVFEAILEKALTLCEAAFGFLTVYETMCTASSNTTNNATNTARLTPIK